MASVAVGLQPDARREGPALVQIVQIHAVNADRRGVWACEACDFLGDLHSAIRHAVRSQWDHVWGPGR